MTECKWFAPANKGARGTRAAWVDDFPPAGISGVYAIANLAGQTLYVGESHTGRLRKTLARHFQEWPDGRQDRFTYDRFKVLVCWMETTDAQAEAAEKEWSLDLEPRDGLLEWSEEPAGVDFDEVPF